MEIPSKERRETSCQSAKVISEIEERKGSFDGIGLSVTKDQSDAERVDVLAGKTEH
jgi:hypothetical protein